MQYTLSASAGQWHPASARGAGGAGHFEEGPVTHFTVAVVIDHDPDSPEGRADLAATLQPFHDFKRTGINDAYVRDVDAMDRVVARLGAWPGGDLKGLAMSFGWGYLNDSDAIDIDGPHRFGHLLVLNGLAARAIDRTNPNGRWLGWSLGGGRPFLCRDRVLPHDYARLGDIDWRTMRRLARDRRRARLAEISLAAGIRPNDADAVHRQVGQLVEAWRQMPEPRPYGRAFSVWLRMQAGGAAARWHAAAPVLPATGPGERLEDWVAWAPGFGATAVVVDGRWHENGPAGSGDPADGATISWAAWDRQVMDLIDTQRRRHPQAWLAMVDCHC
jgi:hypothetical protein